MKAVVLIDQFMGFHSLIIARSDLKEVRYLKVTIHTMFCHAKVDKNCEAVPLEADGF